MLAVFTLITATGSYCAGSAYDRPGVNQRRESLQPVRRGIVLIDREGYIFKARQFTGHSVHHRVAYRPPTFATRKERRVIRAVAATPVRFMPFCPRPWINMCFVQNGRVLHERRTRLAWETSF